MTQAICPSVGEVDATAAVADPILRNLAITAAYSQLANAFASWLPGGANWCTFATWASKQAGCTIRKEDLARTVARRLQERFERRPIPGELHRVLNVSSERLSFVVGELSQALPGVDRASDAVARGNLKVFAEIGREFARFLADPPGDDAALGRFGEGLLDGPPPEGQGLLRRAFMNYFHVRATSGPSARAQLTLLANLQIGLHEQIRLQPEIREAMDAALLDVADTRRRILKRLDELIVVGSLVHVRTGAGRRLLNAVADHIAEDLRLVMRAITTDHLMSIGLPNDRTLRLGREVVGAFPETLRTLSNPELIALLAEYDATPDSTSGSGAVDWSELRQRMHFIADFFRAFQADATLFEPPFPPAELAEIVAGRVPDHV